MIFDEELKETLQQQIALVDDVLTRYTEDEAGESQKEKYNEMTDNEKINLITNTMLNCADWCDFDTDLVINFDYNNY